MGRTKRRCESRKLDRIDNNTEHEFTDDFNPSRSTEWYELDGGLYLHGAPTGVLRDPYKEIEIDALEARLPNSSKLIFTGDNA